MARDSLLFQIGFNTCNISVFDSLVTEDLEFFHDQSGIVRGKKSFIEGTENGLCNLDYQPIRRLIEGTTEIFPLYNNGELYGVIQSGRHQFLAKYPDRPTRVTSEARFTHVWLLKENSWLVSRVLSYEHIPLEE
jgi:hypothetical protein